MEENRNCIDCNAEMLAENFGYYHGFCPKCLGYENFNDYIMTERDFRIGSIVALVATGTDVEITSVNRLGLIEYMEFGDTDEYEDSITAFRPVPLTEEWLLKFGFEETYRSQFRIKYDYPKHFVGYDFNLTAENSMEGFRLYGRWLEGINFVHQLQNLYFALTGEELTLQE